MAEILIDSHRDIGNRKIYASQLASFRGIPAQVVHNVDDKLRPVIFYGDEVGHYEETLLKSDVKDLSRICTETVDTDFTLDTKTYSVFSLGLKYELPMLTFTDPGLSNDQTKTITCIFTNLVNNVNIRFMTDIKWLNSYSSLPTYLNKSYVCKFYYTSTGWIGEYVSVPNNTIIDSNIHSLTEWILPAGSANGDDEDKITDNHFMDITDSEKEVMSNVSNKISDITNVSENLETIESIKRNLSLLNSVNDNATDISSVASSLSKLSSIVGSLADILEVQKYLTNINILAEHIKDKYFLDVKVTNSYITGNTILQLDKIVLAPAEYKSTSEVDTDSSDGTITPTLLVYSEREIQDAAIVDGTIVVTDSQNKINSIGE